MERYNFRIGDRVRFNESWNDLKTTYPGEYTIKGFDDENMNGSTVAYLVEGIAAFLHRLELVEPVSKLNEKDCIDFLKNLGYTISKTF